jgi:hypothetical protein
MAMMCRTRLIRRLPVRDRRWRFWSPEDASIGAVPFQQAKWALLRNRLMSPMSPSRRAAPDGPIPLSWLKRAGSRGDELAEVLVRGPDLRVDGGQLLDEFASELVAGLGDDADSRRHGP